MTKIGETVLPVGISFFSVGLGFIKFTGVSNKRTNQFLAWNVFLLLQRRAFRKEASGTNLSPTLVIGPRSLAIYLFSLLGIVYI